MVMVKAVEWDTNLMWWLSRMVDFGQVPPLGCDYDKIRKWRMAFRFCQSVYEYAWSEVQAGWGSEHNM